MKVSIYNTVAEANDCAATLLARWLTAPGARNVMLAAGNTPLDLYRRIAERGLPLAHLNIFALDEYVGVPMEEPRNCANLIRRTAVQPWGVPAAQYFTVDSTEAGALESVQAHERRITQAGGIDVIVLGLGRNGHLGFNEPGSAKTSGARVLDLDAVSVAANRQWFQGDYAPARGATVGLSTILNARRVLIMAYGPHKAGAVAAMLRGPPTEQCPASLLQGHPDVHVFLDEPAAANCKRRTACVIGIDVGGTKVAAGLTLLPEGRILSRHLIPTQAQRGGRPLLDDVVALARALADEAKTLGHTVDALGLGICELVDRAGTIASSNCIAWLDQPVRDELCRIAPAVIEADVRAAALAEASLGAGRAFATFLYVTVGTGISCCFMLDGRPYLGARGFTGTMGSSPIRVPCGQCDEPNERTLEELASGPALVSRFQAAGGHATQAQDVVRGAAAGDPAAAQIVSSAGRALGSQIGLLVNVLDPEAVILGGGLGLSNGLFVEHVLTSTRQSVWSERQRQLPILRAATGADAGWLGAALRARQEIARGGGA